MLQREAECTEADTETGEPSEEKQLHGVDHFAMTFGTSGTAINAPCNDGRPSLTRTSEKQARPHHNKRTNLTRCPAEGQRTAVPGVWVMYQDQEGTFCALLHLRKLGGQRLRDLKDFPYPGTVLPVSNPSSWCVICAF